MSKEKRPRKGKYRGQNARANTLLSINKTPNYTSSLHQISGFSRPRAALCFLSSRAALYFTKTAEDDDKTTTEEERGSPVCPVNRARERERIFSSSLDAFCLLFVSFLHPRDIFIRAKIFFSFSNTEERQKTLVSLLSPSFVLSKSLFRELSSFFSRTKKFKKTRKEPRERERKPKSLLYPTTTSSIYPSFFCARRWKR